MKPPTLAGLRPEISNLRPMPSDADESPNQPLDYLSFVDHAVDHASSPG